MPSGGGGGVGNGLHAGVLDDLRVVTGADIEGEDGAEGGVGCEDDGGRPCR